MVVSEMGDNGELWERMEDQWCEVVENVHIWCRMVENVHEWW